MMTEQRDDRTQWQRIEVFYLHLCAMPVCSQAVLRRRFDVESVPNSLDVFVCLPTKLLIALSRALTQSQESGRCMERARIQHRRERFVDRNCLRVVHDETNDGRRGACTISEQRDGTTMLESTRLMNEQ